MHKAFRNGNDSIVPSNTSQILASPLVSGIPPGGQFDYIVPINSSGQWGTYWVHAHASVGSLLNGFNVMIDVQILRANMSTGYGLQ